MSLPFFNNTDALVTLYLAECSFVVDEAPFLTGRCGSHIVFCKIGLWIDSRDIETSQQHAPRAALRPQRLGHRALPARPVGRINPLATQRRNEENAQSAG